MKNELAKAGGFVEEALYNRKTIDAFNTQKQEIKNFKCYLRKAERSCLRQIILYALFYGLSEIIGHAMEGGSLVFYAYVVSHNKGKFLIGNLLEIVNILIFEACMSLNEGMPCIKAVNVGCASAKNFFALYSKSKSKSNSTNNSNSIYDTLLYPNKNELQNKEIIFHNVNFTYSLSTLSTCTNKDKTPFHILNASFPLKPNTVNTIIGESGSGKSTLLNLLQKIYPIHSGNITIGKYNINSINTCYLRNLIGYVPQEPLLMNTTIRDNITMGRTGITDVDIYNICEQTHLNELINNKADGLDYVVGVNGSRLSGGEKQRIALARALIGKPLLLILDEPTSALDNLNIKYINDTVRMLSRSITGVCVEHRVN
jgi:ABC-type multidrug transport system fused ATPase/permease subunit